jgi:cell wall-associated NlpC family hydrolase
VTTGLDVVNVARTWLGTKWRHQGRVKGVAVDCIGLVGGVALELGIEGAAEWAADASLHRYGRLPDPVLLFGGCERFMDRIAAADIRIGDVVVMAFDRDPQHFAIVSDIEPMYLIHAYTAVRKVVENGAGIWRGRILRAYRFRGIEA